MMIFKLAVKLMPITLIGVLYLIPSSMAGFSVKSQNPFALIASTPQLEPPQWSSHRQLSHASSTTLSNHWFLTRSDADERLWIDTESVLVINRLAFYQDTYQFYIDLPYIHYGGGFLDDFINDYHHFWGMPNGDRHLYDQRKSQITYQQSQTSFQQRQTITPRSGFADPVIGAGWRFFKTHKSAHAFFSTIKLNTASKSRFLGHKKLATSHFVSHQYASKDWQFDLQYGLMLQRKYQYFSWISRRLVTFGTFALGYRLYEKWRFTLQYDYHSALFKRSRTTPASESHMGTIGFTRKTRKNRWQLAIQEDLSVGSSADVSFSIGYQHFYRL